jgi:hypothetical protein
MTSADSKRRARLHFRIELRVLRLIFGESQQTIDYLPQTLTGAAAAPREAQPCQGAK